MFFFLFFCQHFCVVLQLNLFYLVHRFALLFFMFHLFDSNIMRLILHPNLLAPSALLHIIFDRNKIYNLFIVFLVLFLYRISNLLLFITVSPRTPTGRIQLHVIQTSTGTCLCKAVPLYCDVTFAGSLLSEGTMTTSTLGKKNPCIIWLLKGET